MQNYQVALRHRRIWVDTVTQYVLRRWVGTDIQIRTIKIYHKIPVGQADKQDTCNTGRDPTTPTLVITL